MSGLGHFVWFILTLITGFIALPFWIIAALMCGSSRKKEERAMKKEELELLRQLVKEKK